MKNFPDDLARCVAAARQAKGNAETARWAISCLDLTSLNDTDTHDTIQNLCRRADTPVGPVAAVCVYPEFVATADALAHRNAAIATVINFPHGDRTTKGTLAADEEATPKNTYEATLAAIDAGASEIDIVMDYKSFLAGDHDKPAALLAACRKACTDGSVKLKIIIETAAFGDYNDLHDACALALNYEADFLKTSTGKHPNGGATLESAAALIQAIQDLDGYAGCKVSGGVKTNDDAAQYLALIRKIHGHKTWLPHTDFFRFGASGVLDDLIRVLSNAPATARPAPGAY